MDESREDGPEGNVKKRKRKKRGSVGKVEHEEIQVG